MQRKPLVILASFITKKVSVKKHNLIILYRNIRSLATRLCDRGVFGPQQLSCVVESRVLSAVAWSICNILESVSADDPLGWIALVDATLAYASLACTSNNLHALYSTVVLPMTAENFDVYSLKFNADSRISGSYLASILEMWDLI